MDLTTITPQAFQSQFFRDFPYLNIYSAATTYNTGTSVYYNGLFYTALQNSLLNVTPGTNGSDWQQTDGCANDYVQIQDITNAFAEAQIVFNQNLFASDAAVTLAYLYCTAHYLVNDLRAAMAGINGTGQFPVASRSVGSMSESYQIPDRFKDNAQLAFFTSTPYGQKFLSLVLPNLVGNMAAVWGGTNP